MRILPNPRKDNVIFFDRLKKLHTDAQKQLMGRLPDLSLTTRQKLILTSIGVPLGVASVAVLSGVYQGLLLGHDLPASITYALTAIPMATSYEQPEWENVNQIVQSLTQQDFQTAVKAFLPEAAKYGMDIRVLITNLVAAGFGARFFVDQYNKKKELMIGVERGEVDITPRGEQTIVLAGRGSTIAEKAVKGNLNNHVLITATHEAATNLVEDNGRRVNRGEPIYLNLGLKPDQKHKTIYTTNAWEHLKLSEGNLVTATNGRRYLFIQAHGESPNQELTSHLNVLPADIDAARTKLGLQLRQRGIDLKPDQFFIVYVVDGDNTIQDILDAKPKPVREIAEETGVQVIVDIKEVVAQEVAKIISLDAERKSTGARLGTNSVEFLEKLPHLGRLLKQNHNIKVLTPEQESGLSREALPTLVLYSGDLKNTLTDARRATARFPSRQVIAIVPDFEQEKEEFMDIPPNVKFISIADAVNERIKYAKSQLKMGKSSEEIQSLVENFDFDYDTSMSGGLEFM